jgi:hypothetical protein
MKNLTLILVVVAMTSNYAVGQTITPQVINTSGNTYQHGNQVLEWSIGELPLVNQLQSSSGVYIITNGFLQPVEQQAAPPDPDHYFSDEEIRILPNPTRGIIEVRFATLQKGKMKLLLYNTLGYIIYNKEFTSSGNGHIEKINLTGFAGGAYMLRIILNPDPGSIQKNGVYKILKIS